MESISNRMSRLGRTELCYGRIIPAEEIVEKTSKLQLAKLWIWWKIYLEKINLLLLL